MPRTGDICVLHRLLLDSWHRLVLRRLIMVGDSTFDISCSNTRQLWLSSHCVDDWLVFVFHDDGEETSERGVKLCIHLCSQDSKNSAVFDCTLSSPRPTSKFLGQLHALGMISQTMKKRHCTGSV